ncbi:hypothetical protein [Undibacterium sp. Tian12W]|uniref:hypothetical protein n=1 Tax=Undibacterium sp. Tian12W TaxID=3413054 RepID=UPI003BF3CFDA
MSKFKASVQYQDFEGTAAADNADQTDLQTFLQAKGLTHGAEFLIAASLWIGENHAGKLGMVNITAHLFQNGDYRTPFSKWRLRHTFFKMAITTQLLRRWQQHPIPSQ